jgi:hypothetical protein
MSQLEKVTGKVASRLDLTTRATLRFAKIA